MPTDQRRANSQLQDIQLKEGGRELIWYTCQAIQGAVDHHGAEAKICERHCVDMCGTTEGCDFVRKMTPGSRLARTDLNSGNRLLVVTQWK